MATTAAVVTGVVVVATPAVAMADNGDRVGFTMAGVVAVTAPAIATGYPTTDVGLHRLKFSVVRTDMGCH